MAKFLALIIEDDQDQAFVFQSVMKGAGFEIEIVIDSADARSSGGIQSVISQRLW